MPPGGQLWRAVDSFCGCSALVTPASSTRSSATLCPAWPRQTPLLAGADQVALVAMICTPLSASVIAAAMLRRSATNSVGGAAKLLADALVIASRWCPLDW
jgi:hypothetical protein